MRLRDLQLSMVEAVFGHGEVPGLEPEHARFYRELSHGSYQSTLDALYEATRWVYVQRRKSSDWDRACVKYIRERRPSDYRLNWLGDRFASELGARGWLRELAQFEWAQFVSGSGRDFRPGDRVNPTLTLLEQNYRVAAWYQRWVEDDAPPALLRKDKLPKRRKRGDPGYLAVFRDPKTYETRILGLEPAAFGLLQSWQDGETPDSSADWLAEQTGRPRAGIREQIRGLEAFLRTQGILS